MAHNALEEGEKSILLTGLSRYLSAGQLAELAGAHVGIAGAGGLGSNCALLLARSGIRSFTLVDFDLVESSNLNRQHFFPADLGRFKVEALGEALQRLDPGLHLTLRAERLTTENAAQYFAGCTVVVEALDDALAKAALCNILLESGVFIVAASGLAGLGGPPMQKRRLGKNIVCVGDFVSDISLGLPPLAPRVMQAAAMQAEAVLEHLLNKDKE